MIDGISVDSAVAYAETLEYDCLYGLHTCIQAIVKEKALPHAKTTGKTKPVVANGVSLPPDVVYQIYKFLPPKTIYETRLVCRAMYHAASDQRVWTELPDSAYNRGGRLYDKTSSEMANMLSQYPHLTHLKLWNMSIANAEDIDTITAVIPNVTHVDLRYPDSNQTALDKLVANLPIKWLATPGVIPTDMSSLVHLVLSDTGFGFEHADPLTIKSRVLKYLVLESHYGSLHGSILENNPNLEELIALNASADHPWASASLKRLSIGKINHPQAIEGLSNLEHLEFHCISVEGVGNQHVSVVYGDLTVCSFGAYTRTLGLDLANCPNVRTQYLDGSLEEECGVEDTNTPRLQTLVATSDYWIVNSRFPDLVTLTLDWEFLPVSEVLLPLQDLIATDWAKKIRHLHLCVKKSDCSIEIARCRDNLFGRLFRAMGQLRTFRSAGLTLNFSQLNDGTNSPRDECVNVMLSELTLGGVEESDPHIPLDCIDRFFPNLRILRMPADATKRYTSVDFQYEGAFEVQVPLSDQHKTSADFKDQVKRKRAGYYLPLPMPWFYENRITKYSWKG